MYRNERLELRLTPQDLRILDQVRGPITRSAWLRHQIHQAGAKYVSVTELKPPHPKGE